jgi:hypothetical protein
MRLLGRTVELEMTLRTFDPYRLIAYTSVQAGLPDVRHERGQACAERSTAGLSAVRSSAR